VIVAKEIKFTCPKVLKDPVDHNEARFEAIQSWGFGPPSNPILARNSGYWFKKGQVFNVPSSTAQSVIRCSKCEYYDASLQMRQCIEKGETDERRREFPTWGRRVAEHGPGIGFCIANGIKVQSGNSCDRFVPASRLASRGR